VRQYRLNSNDYVEFLVRFESIELDGSAVPLRAAPDLSGSVFTLDSPYGEDLLVAPDDAIRENLFVFAMKHLHLENFDWGWTTVPAQQSKEPPRTFPPGVHFRARIVTSIDSNTAAPGDPIEAVLLSPIPGKDGREWAPAGAHLRGHLLGLHQGHLLDLKQEILKNENMDILEVLMQFEVIELNGSDVPFQAAPDLSELYGISTGAGAYVPGVSVIPDPVLRMNVFIFRKEHLHLNNFDWGWTTSQAQQSPP
jgi:hypothetical protein